MTFTPRFAPTVFIAAFALAPAAWAAQDAGHSAHHPAIQTAQTAVPAGMAPMMPDMARAPGKPGSPGAADMQQQMQTMQAMHEKMMAAKTPAERQALMAEHMAVMQDGMGMMGQMGRGRMAATPDMGARQGMLEQRMDMMQSMMQMMMDRMSPFAAAN